MAGRYWDSGIGDPSIASAVHEMFADFRFDDVPDADQQIESMFLEFAEQIVEMVPSSQYVLAGLRSLAQARLYFVEARVVAEEEKGAE